MWGKLLEISEQNFSKDKMAKISYTKTAVEIKLEGIKKFLALKGSLKIPFRCIKQVSSKPANWLIFTPKAGTNFPGLIMAGTFFRRNGMVFYYVRDLKKCITLSLKDHRYSQVIIEVDDKNKTAQEIRDLVKDSKS